MSLIDIDPIDHDTFLVGIKDSLVGVEMRKKVILACSECGSRNYSTMSKKESERLELKKHCDQCQAHTVHRETK